MAAVAPPGRTLAIAIGVGKAKGVAALPGAVNGALGFCAWAQRMGHDAVAITDQIEDLTLDRLRNEVSRALTETPIQRLLLYFAGHGLMKEIGDGLWLLSDWELGRAVSVDLLRRRLRGYGIEQIAIFSDACRKFPGDLHGNTLAEDPVIDNKPITNNPAIAKFSATQEGAATFMIAGSTPAEHRCLFSGVLLESLWGTRPAAFSVVVPGCVTASSLGRYLEAEVNRLATGWQRTVVPEWTSSFPETAFFYRVDGQELGPSAPPPSPPEFPPWPPAIEIEVSHVPLTGYDVTDASNRLLNKMRAERLQSVFQHEGFVVGPDQFQVRDVEHAWSLAQIELERLGRGCRAASKGHQDLRDTGPVVLELTGGVFVITTAIPSFTATITAGYGGAAAIIYREVYAAHDVTNRTEEAIAALAARATRVDAKLDLAVELRQEKHVDPVRGVLSAYLYESVGDVDSVRRIAYAYAERNQPIPYDVALLAQLEGSWDGSSLIVDVPAVPERSPRTDLEQKHGWTWSATAVKTAMPVAGVCPWLRDGWIYLDDPVDWGSPLIRPVLHQLQQSLQPARFTTLDEAGQLAFCAEFQLEQKF
jgi:hypothetical protein